MSNLFAKLTSFGINPAKIKDKDIFAKEDKDRLDEGAVNLENYLTERNITCVVCDKHFTSVAVITSKLKLLSTDTDFKPLYEPLNPLFYEIVICPHCGYASMASTFKQIRETAFDAVKKEITPNYTHKHYPKILDVDNAIERFQLALYSSVIKKAKSSEMAYTCLKLGWLCREAGHADDEKMYLTEAAKGFAIAFESENLPLFGMDSPTLQFLLGELNRRIGNREEALRFLSRVVVEKGINPRLKDRAMDMRDQLRRDAAQKE